MAQWIMELALSLLWLRSLTAVAQVLIPGLGTSIGFRLSQKKGNIKMTLS